MSASAPNYLNTTLYVGDLHHAATEAMLFDKFSRVAPVVSIRVCRHVITRRSLGYAYVNFRDPAGAEHALKTMNFELIMGRPIRIMWSQRDPSLRKSGIGNIFVKNLEKSIDSLALKNMFSRFGNILSCKVACNGRGSKGHGFVHFETMEAAENAIIEMNGALFNDRKVFVGHFRSRQERETKTGDKEKDFTNIYIKNFGKDMNDKRLKETFGKYGPTVSVRVMTDNWGKSKGFGFVSYQRHEDAERAVDSMNGTEINGRRIYVARAQKRAERRAAQICQLEQKKQETMTTHYQVMTEGGFSKASEALHEEDCLAQQENMCIQMMANNQALSNPVVNLHQLEPSLAINYHPALHSVINPNQPEPNCMAHNYLCVPCSGIHCRPMLPPAIDPCQPVPIPAITNVQPLPNLTINDQPEPKQTVTIDQPMLSSAITTDQPVPNAAATNDQPVLNPAIGYQPMQHTTFDVYPPVPSMAFSSYQHVPSSAFGFDHPVLCPRFNPYQTALPMEDFMATFPQAQNVNAYNPINQMAQLIPGRCWAPESMWSQDFQIFPGHRRLSVPYFGNVMPALTQVPDEMTYLKFDTRNPMRFPIGLPVDATPMSGVTQFGCTAGVDDSLEQLSTQPQCTLMQPTIPEPLTISFLASLSNDDREQTLGHRLYPLIQDQKPDLAPKITGMLLELENSEILQLLESSESLHSKVDEAVAVLQAFWASEATAAGLASRVLQDNRTAGEHNPEQQKINPPPQGTKQQPAVPVKKQDRLTLSYLDGLSYNDRDQILGKHLHSLILGQQPDLAPKITGMLLELENTKILKFLETPESLHAKVSEAVSVLQDFWAKEAMTKANAEETVTTEANAEEAVTTEANAEEAVTTEVNAEEAVTTEVNAEEAVTTEANAEEAVTTEANAEETVTTEGNAEETMTTEVNAEH